MAETITVVFQKERDTKNTVRFQEVVGEGEPERGGGAVRPEVGAPGDREPGTARGDHRAGLNMARYRIGVDLGDAHVGLAVAEIVDGEARPVWLGVVDLMNDKGGPRKLYPGRAGKRRFRRTLKSRRRRLGEIREILRCHGVPEEIAATAVALCARRGWEPDTGGVGSTTEAQEAPDKALRRPRKEVVAWIKDRLIQTGVPAGAAEEVAGVLLRRPRARGMNNRLVGKCANSDCPGLAAAQPGGKRKHAANSRALGVEWTALWLLSHLLAVLSYKRQAPRREFFLAKLREKGIDPDADLRSFRTPNNRNLRRNRVFEAVRDAWNAAVAAELPLGDGALCLPLSEGAIRQVEKLFDDARARISGRRPPSRTRFCPVCLHKRVRALAEGRDGEVPQGSRAGEGKSLVWRAFAARLERFLTLEVLPDLPPGTVDEIQVERAAFDTLRIVPERDRDGRRKTPSIPDEMRWLGVWGQLARMAKHADRRSCLAWETGELCAVCGKPLGKDVDIAHIIPREWAGGISYLHIAAAHSGCNQGDGKRLMTVHPSAVEAMRRARKALGREFHWVHAWMDAKLGIFQELMPSPDGGPRVAEDIVRRQLERAFAMAESTMQSADLVAGAVKRAVRLAGRGAPEVRMRAATEVARAREMATGGAEGEAWFDKTALRRAVLGFKRLSKEENDFLERDIHAIDAFVCAALPRARPVTFKGETRYVLPGNAEFKRLLACLGSEEEWRKAVGGTVWRGIEGLKFWTLGPRRFWRQAWLWDTILSPKADNGRRGEHRQPAPQWFEKLKGCKSQKEVEQHLKNIQFAPLRGAAMKAFEGALHGGADVRAGRDAAARAVVQKLRGYTLRGLKSDGGPTCGHPVREARINALRDWAKGKDDSPDKVPVWVGIKLRRNRRSGGDHLKTKAACGVMAGKQWAWAVVAARPDGKDEFTFGWLVRPNGKVKALRGAPDLDSCALLAAMPRDAKVPPHPIAVPAWRRALAGQIRSMGVKSAVVVTQGCVVQVDGKRIRIDSQEQAVKFGFVVVRSAGRVV